MNNRNGTHTGGPDIPNTSPIEKEVQKAVSLWFDTTEKMLIAIMQRKGIKIDEMSTRGRVEYFDNIKKYYIDDELVLTATIITEDKKIMLTIEPEGQYKNV